MPDNLSLRRVIQSGRPTQEQGLRREIAIIRDQIAHNDLRVRLVKNEAMLADHLTKNRGGEQLYNVLKTGRIRSVKDYDSGEVSKEAIDKAANDIPLIQEDDILHVDIATMARTIVHPEETDDETASPSRQLTTGRKASATIQSRDTSEN